MNRFRPNIVLAGGGSPAWADDTWQSITISSNGVANAGSSGAGGSTVLQYVKPCSRCKVRTPCPMFLLMLFVCRFCSYRGCVWFLRVALVDTAPCIHVAACHSLELCGKSILAARVLRVTPSKASSAVYQDKWVQEWVLVRQQPQQGTHCVSNCPGHCLVDECCCMHWYCMLQVTTINQDTTEEGRQPLTILGTFRCVVHVAQSLPECWRYRCCLEQHMCSVPRTHTARYWPTW
jgi:hypothetical protein